MVKIYNAGDLIQAQAILNFLNSKDVQGYVSENFNPLQVGVTEVPVLVAEQDYSDKLRIEVEEFLSKQHKDFKTNKVSSSRVEFKIEGPWKIRMISSYFIFPQKYFIGPIWLVGVGIFGLISTFTIIKNQDFRQSWAILASIAMFFFGYKLILKEIFSCADLVFDHGNYLRVITWRHRFDVSISNIKSLEYGYFTKTVRLKLKDPCPLGLEILFMPDMRVQMLGNRSEILSNLRARIEPSDIVS